MTQQNLPAELAVIAPVVTHETEQAKRFAGQLADLVVQTPRDIELASQLLLDVKERGKAITAKKEEVTKPTNAFLKAVRDFFRPAEQAYAEAESILKKKISVAQAAIMEANRQAMIATQAALAAGQVREAAALSSTISGTEAPKGISYQERWSWRIVNAAILPREFLMPDERKIREHVAKHGLGSNIPGVHVEKDMTIVARPGSRG